MVSRSRLSLPTDRYCHSVPKFQPPELLPEEQLGRLLVVRRPKLAPFGVPAERFRGVRTEGVSVLFFRRRAPRVGVKMGRPFLRVRARVHRFSFFAFTSSPVCRKVLTYSLIRVKALPAWVHLFAFSREELS